MPVSEFTANPAAGAKFSEFGHPFVCFADISPIRGITPPYPAKCISCVGNSLDRSAKLHQNYAGEHSSPLRLGNNLRVVPQNHIKPCGRFVNRPYNRAPSRRPLRSHCFLCVGNGQCPFRNSQQILRREQAPALPYKHKHKPQFVILSEVKDLKPKYKMCETRFFA